MKCAILISVFVALAALASAMEIPNNGLLDPRNSTLRREVLRLRKDIVDRGCDRNICFALQGGTLINNADYLAQKNFIDILVAILQTDEPGNLCATQYSSVNQPISRLTGRRNNFLNRIGASRRSRRGAGPNIDGALRYTSRQLGPFVEDANKIVLFGEGLGRFQKRTITLANRIRRGGAEICAVAVGDSSVRDLSRITGSRSRVFQIDEYFQLAEVIVALVRSVCGLN